MRAKLISVGNSKGIRIPKTLIEQCHLQSEVQLEVRNGELVIRSEKIAREGWSEAFQRMSNQADDRLIDPILSTSWDKKEWKW